MTAALIPERLGHIPAGATVTVVDRHGEEKLRWETLVDQAFHAAARVAERAPAGATVAVAGPTSVDLLRAIVAVWLAGCAVTVVPTPDQRRGHRGAGQLGGGASTAALLIGPADVLAAGTPAGVLTLNVGELVDGQRSAARAVEGHDAVVRQYTSGSTGVPAPVAISHQNLAANMAASAVRAAVSADDTFASWLPLHHDMGLVGMFAFAAYTGTSLALADPSTFATRPASWLEMISRHKATVTAAPNFAYALLARTAPPPEVRLGSLRAAFCGAEPVVVEHLERFIDVHQPAGLRSEAIAGAYGMAEATVAISFREPGSGLAAERIDPDALAAGEALRADRGRALALLGAPLDGVEVRVVDADGSLAGRRRVGEIELRGPSIANEVNGVVREPSSWFSTGDLGYRAGEELVVCGRAKDLLIVAGRNIYPQDIELAAASVPGVRAGRVVAFGEPGARGTDDVVVVAEVRDSMAAPEHVAAAVRSDVGVTPRRIVFVEPGSIPLTSSGKLQRRACRAALRAGELATVEAHPTTVERRRASSDRPDLSTNTPAGT